MTSIKVKMESYMKSKEEKLNQFGKTVEFSKSADFHKG